MPQADASTLASRTRDKAGSLTGLLNSLDDAIRAAKGVTERIAGGIGDIAGAASATRNAIAVVSGRRNDERDPPLLQGLFGDRGVPVTVAPSSSAFGLVALAGGFLLVFGFLRRK